MADPTIISRTLPPRRFLTDLAIWFRNKVIQTFLQIQHEIFCKNKYRPEDKFVPNWIPPDKSLVELSGLWREGKIEDVPSRFGDLSFLFIFLLPEKTALVCCVDAAVIQPVEKPGESWVDFSQQGWQKIWGHWQKWNDKGSWNLGTAGRMVGLRAFMSAVRVLRLPE